VDGRFECSPVEGEETSTDGRSNPTYSGFRFSTTVRQKRNQSQRAGSGAGSGTTINMLVVSTDHRSLITRFRRERSINIPRQPVPKEPRSAITG
jgi:hypothetical protein